MEGRVRLQTLVLIAACGGTGASPSSAVTPTAAPSAEQPSAAAPTPTGPSSKLLATVCDDPCAGPDSLTLWRDDQGALQLVVYSGDHAICSHVMTVWYDATGRELRRSSDKPVSPEVAERGRREVEALVEGLQEAEQVGCTR